MLTARHKYVVHNTLISLLKGIEGEVTTVELRNERKVRGMIENVDDSMNVHMSDVSFMDVMGRTTEFSNFYIQGRNIRFVHIPDHVDIIEAMQNTLERYGRAHRHVEKRAPKQRCLTSKEQKEKLKQKAEEKRKEMVKALKELENNKKISQIN